MTVRRPRFTNDGGIKRNFHNSGRTEARPVGSFLTFPSASSVYRLFSTMLTVYVLF